MFSRQTYQGIGSTELVNDYIPPTRFPITRKKTHSVLFSSRFNMITAAVILICLVIGILVPDIELVLGLVGSTMGSCVCTILPALMFLKLTNKVDILGAHIPGTSLKFLLFVIFLVQGLDLYRGQDHCQ